MQTFAVQSTTMAAIGYDGAESLLQLEFRDRSVYRYFGVPEHLHEGLMRAPSKGRYFNRHIRGRFADALVPDAFVHSNPSEPTAKREASAAVPDASKCGVGLEGLGAAHV